MTSIYLSIYLSMLKFILFSSCLLLTFQDISIRDYQCLSSFYLYLFNSTSSLSIYISKYINSETELFQIRDFETFLHQSVQIKRLTEKGLCLIVL